MGKRKKGALVETELYQKMKRSLEDTRWLFEQFPSLQVEYPNKWVAVLEKKVIGFHENIEELQKILEIEYKEDANFIYLHFVASKEVRAIL